MRFPCAENAVIIHGYPKHNAPCQSPSGGVADTEELYLSDAARVHVSNTLTPLHKGDLDIIISFDCDEITIFIAVSQLEHALADTTAGEASELGVDTIDERLVGNVESYHKSDVVARFTVDSDLELCWHRHVWAEKTRRLRHSRGAERRRDCPRVCRNRINTKVVSARPGCPISRIHGLRGEM